MSSRLVDLADDEHDLSLGEWGFGPTAWLLGDAGVLGLAEQVQLKEAGLVEVDRRRARAFAAYLRGEVLPALPPLGWIDSEGERHEERDDLSLARLAQGRRHHLGREAVERLAAFCERCGGFFVV